jgi:hypothetical protein
MDGHGCSPNGFLRGGELGNLTISKIDPILKLSIE